MVRKVLCYNEGKCYIELYRGKLYRGVTLYRFFEQNWARSVEVAVAKVAVDEAYAPSPIESVVQLWYTSFYDISSPYMYIKYIIS
jgi:hypothetical protein